MLKEPSIPVNRKQTIVRGWNACVLQTNADGSITPTRASTSINGCSATDFSNYAWLIPRNELLTYRTNPLRSGQIRMPGQFTAHLSVNKNFQITERLRFQFRAERSTPSTASISSRSGTTPIRSMPTGISEVTCPATPGLSLAPCATPRRAPFRSA